jgi:hypothetical protein
MIIIYVIAPSAAADTTTTTTTTGICDAQLFLWRLSHGNTSVNI